MPLLFCALQYDDYSCKCQTKSSEDMNILIKAILKFCTTNQLVKRIIRPRSSFLIKIHKQNQNNASLEMKTNEERGQILKNRFLLQDTAAVPYRCKIARFG